METYPKSMAHPWASRLRVSVVVGLVLALVFGALGVTPAKADTTTGLVLHWTFEEGSGTVTQDQTLNDLDGSITAPEGSWSPDVPPGSSGHSIYLGGKVSKDYVTSAASALFPSGSSARTLCAWVKSADGARDVWAGHIVNYGTPGGDGYAFGMMIFDGDRWWFYGHGAPDLDTGIPATTTWHHHCATYDGTTVTYYLDGAQVASGAKSLSTTANTSMVVGVRPDIGWDTYFDGWVDDVRLYDRALSAADVAEFVSGLTHTVTFHANGGTGSMSPQTAVSPNALTANAFTLTGYSFAGWDTSSAGATVAYNNGATYDFSADIDLYAVWAPNHTVTFHANGGTGSMSPQSAAFPTALTPNTFTLTGYSFAGWDTSPAGTTVVYANGATYSFAADADLYAVWAPKPNHTVTKAADTNDGVCDADCSLREAIAVAAAGDTVVFVANLSGQTIRLASPLSIGKNLTIDGSALAVPVSINGDSDNNGAGNVNVFIISGPHTVDIKGLTITRGNASSTSYGGAIYNSGGSVTVTNVTFDSNQAPGVGGAIYSSGGSITVNSCTFNANTTVSIGGAIMIQSAALTVANSIFTNNISTGWWAGGIFFDAGSRVLTVSNSTFSGNRGTQGGGIYVFAASSATVTGSTFSGNTATETGGAIFSQSNLAVVNSTFTGNTAPAGNGSAIRNVGTIYLTNSTLSDNFNAGAFVNHGGAQVRNTIMANTTGGSDCIGNVFAVNLNNLIESRSDCSAPLIPSDPVLGPLANNGGPTQTMALLAGSPAIDTGDPATCSTPVGSPQYGAGGVDQRGAVRPQGAGCDIGAYELQANHTVTFDANDGTGTMAQQLSSVPAALTANTFTRDRLQLRGLE